MCVLSALYFVLSTKLLNVDLSIRLHTKYKVQSTKYKADESYL